MSSRRTPGVPQDRISIGIMGGTFDPVHYGHLVAAEAARYAFGLQWVVFVPSGWPPHKQTAPTDAEHRYLMVSLATADNEAFRVSRIEFDRPGKSYTIDTIREFRRHYGPAVDLWFITGADAICEMLTWKEPQELLRECRFIAATRPGYSVDCVGELTKALGSAVADRIFPLQVPALSISSSDIRRRVAEGEPIRYLVPTAVEYYVRKHRLYLDVQSGRKAEDR